MIGDLPFIVNLSCLENHRQGAKNAKILQRALFIPSMWLGGATGDSFENHRKGAENAESLQEAISSPRCGSGAPWATVTRSSSRTCSTRWSIPGLHDCEARFLERILRALEATALHRHIVWDNPS
ncbi:MAG: hypothetical protein D6723_03940 [Acidobacteria bacterium]|nr:MAG: hypothetical protein D6723_03940 [Acidobacteriota bacterium]